MKIQVIELAEGNMSQEKPNKINSFSRQGI